jgi:hypothetical protein
MSKRQRVEHQFTLQDRIIAWAKEVREQAAALPPGTERDIFGQLARIAAEEIALCTLYTDRCSAFELTNS